MSHRIMKEQDQYAQVLRNAMELCNYDKSIRSEVLDWFQDSTLPFLRPGSKTKWVPHLTQLNSPSKIAYTTAVRGPKTALLDLPSRPLEREADTKRIQDVQMEIINMIKSQVEELDLELFNHLSEAFFITPKVK